MRMRREFHPKVMIAAWDRADGCCEKCKSGRKLIPGDIFYDHVIPDAMGGEPTLENCQVLCRNHHDAKTFKHDIPAIAKSNRVRKRHAGIKRIRRTIPGRRFDGTPIPSRLVER